MVNIDGLDKAAVLAALYNNACVQGMGFLQAKPGDMSLDEARELLERGTYFDYVHGRVVKVSLHSDTEFSPYLYDRDNGAGAAQRAVDALRAQIMRTAS